MNEARADRNVLTDCRKSYRIRICQGLVVFSHKLENLHPTIDSYEVGFLDTALSVTNH